MGIPLVLGRYMICDEIGAGGMATVHLGRVLGAAGFSRVVAIKRLHSHWVDSAKLVTMLVDEARIASRIRHPNVVSMIDVTRIDEELLLIMEYVHGPSLAWVQSTLRLRAEQEQEQAQPMPLRMATRIIIDVLEGLHAAHQAKSERGRALEIVHRDVSPQNILIGEDGIARVADFGIAKAEGRLSFTQDGEIKGKLSYMSPEQLRGQPLDLRSDIFAAGVVLWEMLTGRRLFAIDVSATAKTTTTDDPIRLLLEMKAEDPPSKHAAAVPSELDAVVMKALSVDADKRFADAEAMASAVSKATNEIASTKELAQWTREIARTFLAQRQEQVEHIEQVSAVISATPPTTPADTIEMTQPALLATPPSMTTLPMATTLPLEEPMVAVVAPPQKTLRMQAPSTPPAADGTKKKRIRTLLVLGVGVLVVGGIVFVVSSTTTTTATKKPHSGSPSANAIDSESPVDSSSLPGKRRNGRRRARPE